MSALNIVCTWLLAARTPPPSSRQLHSLPLCVIGVHSFYFDHMRLAPRCSEDSISKREQRDGIIEGLAELPDKIRQVGAGRWATLTSQPVVRSSWVLACTTGRQVPDTVCPVGAGSR